jgi:mycothiol synthase
MDTILTNRMLFPGLPGLPELILRGFRGAEDFPKMLACIDGSKAADGAERSDKLEDMVNNYAHLHHCNTETDMCLAEVDGQVVGYSRVWWEIDEYAQQWTGFHFGFLLPEWRRKGIGSTLLCFNETRLAQIYTELKAAGEIPAEMPGACDCFVDETAQDTVNLLERRGYKAVRYGFNMVRPDLENIPNCPLPEGLEVRPVEIGHLRKIWEASNEAFKDHWGYIAEPWEEYVRIQSDPDFDPTLWRVAWDGDQVAGMVLSFIDKDQNAEYGRLRGYTENICVRRPWRKRGLARALIALSLQALKERGMTDAGLGVDAENISGALGLYQSMGYQVVRRGITYRKGLG